MFVAYVFFGSGEWVPETHALERCASVGKSLWHYWIQDEGVFGKPLDVSATMIFLFVLFGSILEKAGAGNYFIQLAFSLLGHLRGGPAKAAVVASALSGVYSGSSIANVGDDGHVHDSTDEEDRAGRLKRPAPSRSPPRPTAS